ncbi:MAG TPA: LL-diaminopimelate aminotransferase [Opitutaceae bacterium]|nr:LL-diaminopimelate aminotransferase [Opitutaceae bacterium]
MIRVNEHYLKLKASYLFADIARRVNEWQQHHQGAKLIRMGIGDVTEPLPTACIDAFHHAVDEMANRETFKGYGPEQGYAFLREAIAAHEFGGRGVSISSDEIFVSDSAKCDTGNLQEIFSDKITVAVPDPVYPAYVDSNVMAGRTGANENDRYNGLVYLESTEENGYFPALPKEPVDLIYLCFPNNPTGATATKEQLKIWVDYAKANRAILLFDAAYVSFIRNPSLPHTIYEIEGAREVAIEFRSFSKNAGFTGTRCAFTVVPKQLAAWDSLGHAHSVHAIWNRRHTTKFNGVSYPVQRAAAAVYTHAGAAQVRELTDFYLGNAKLIRASMERLGLHCVGGDNAPYIWIKTGGDSWQFFDRLLNEAAVVCTPGAGFGRCGQGYVRLSAFNSRANVEEALARIEKVLAK